MGAWVLTVEVGAGAVRAAVASHRGTRTVRIDGRPVLPPALLPEDCAPVLTAVAGQARQAARGRAARPSRLVVAHPQDWAEGDLAALRKAADLAGLPPPEFLPAPPAAARYLTGRTRPGQHVAVLYAGTDRADMVVAERTDDGARLAGEPGSVTGPAGADPAALLGAAARALLATISGAGLAPDQLAAIHVTGDPALGQQAAELVTEIAGDAPSPAIDLGTGAVLGAAAGVVLTAPRWRLGRPAPGPPALSPPVLSPPDSRDEPGPGPSPG